MNSKDLIKLAQKVEFAEQNIDKRSDLVSSFHLLKSTVPFSQRLNDWITDWFLANKDKFIFTDTDDFDGSDIPKTLLNHIFKYKETGKIHIWTGKSDGTIFGNPTVNHYFRAWHDYTHITHALGYDFAGESIVASTQASQLPNDWFFEKELIMIEVLGQNQYYNRHKEYLKDQRLFAYHYLINANHAILCKQGFLDLRKQPSL